MSTPWQVNIFGVRHLSPAGAWHLRRYLDQLKPDLVLIEGLSDANELIEHMVRKGTKPPIALLAYTDSLPVRTLIYPLARYSPEFQAMAWANEHKTPCQYIDLPSDIFLALQDVEAELRIKARDEALKKKEEEDKADKDPEKAEVEKPIDKTPDVKAPTPNDVPVSMYEAWAQKAGESDHETYWERNFEHNTDTDAYRLAAFEFGNALRELETLAPRWLAENLVREAYMRRKIEEAIKSGYKPGKIVAIVGAFHAPVLNGSHPSMTDAELKSLRRRGSKFTLMPYSYFKLSSQSGYGAGNRAPAYYELLYESLESSDLGGLPSKYLTSVARHSRDAGTHRSTAEVIEGVRLANTLSAMKEGLAPTLTDLRDAAITLIGHGELSAVKDAIARVEVGTAIGALPKGVSQTSIQDDFNREMTRLKLDKYKQTVKQELSLDLRENRQAKTEEAAYLDLNRSSFLHRLRILGVQFATPVRTSQSAANWAEKWALAWSPENEIQLIEAVLLGETVELATGFKFKSILESTTSIGAAAEVVADAARAGLMKAMDAARARLQELAAEGAPFPDIAHAAHTLGLIVRYGDVRQFDPTPLLPLIEELFVQGALALHAAAACDNEAAKPMMVAIHELNNVALEHADRVDEPMWVSALRRLSDADDRNPLLSGFACAILLERGLLSNDDLTREVSRRLSPGVPADLGAGWFEGLSKRNRYALLARQLLWSMLADYIAALDEDHFRRSLVFLRRAFGNFSPREKRQIAENLAEHWGAHADTTAEELEKALTEEEQKTLTEVNDFNFDDL